MLRTLTLENYRGFSHFELHDLGRVNLIVGTNNSGKTSILEAIHLLHATSNQPTLWSVLAERGEVLHADPAQQPLVQLSIRHLFHGHTIVPGRSFSIAGANNSHVLRLTATLSDWSDSPGLPENAPTTENPVRHSGGAEDGWDPTLEIVWQGEMGAVTSRLKTTARGGIVADPTYRGRRQPSERPRVLMIPVNAIRPGAVVQLFEKVVLTSDEDLVVQALQIIEPSIERLAPVGAEPLDGWPFSEPSRAGLMLRCKGVTPRLPIGTMGSGIWRLLGLTLALIDCRDGVLLVDEIDTGLHYSVMEKMWKLVTETARRLNVQVFATTHSRDCYESLAAVCRDDVTAGSEVTIQRIEPTKGRSVAYSEAEIIAAARWATEVR